MASHTVRAKHSLRGLFYIKKLNLLWSNYKLLMGIESSGGFRISERGEGQPIITGGGLGTHTLPQSNFFHFYVVFGKTFFPNN